MLNNAWWWVSSQLCERERKTTSEIASELAYVFGLWAGEWTGGGEKAGYRWCDSASTVEKERRK